MKSNVQEKDSNKNVMRFHLKFIQQNPFWNNIGTGKRRLINQTLCKGPVTLAVDELKNDLRCGQAPYRTVSVLRSQTLDNSGPPHGSVEETI